MLHTALAILLALIVGGPAAPRTQSAGVGTTEGPHITVHRVKTCGCCGKWIDHLKAAGFTVTEHIREEREGAPGRDLVPEKLRSCHTAEAGGYVVEGHVPADVIRELLRSRPAIAGITVPGMPAGSPGMESPKPEAYDVVAFDKAGRTSVFKSIPAAR